MITALEPLKDLNEEEIKDILAKHFKNVPDIQSKYVINDGISKLIARYYNGTVNTFPLYKISLKIDRKPVKIPWTLDYASKENDLSIKKQYKYVKRNASNEKSY